MRVTVASETRRVDLLLPGAVPVAELLPELARSVGLLDPSTVHGGYTLTTLTGRPLLAAAGLAEQGVVDGDLLLVDAAGPTSAPRVHDDVVEAMVDVVAQRRAPGRWGPFPGYVALGCAGLLLTLGAAALLLSADPRTGTTGAVLAALLVSASLLLGRVRRDHVSAAVLAWAASGTAAVAGWQLATDSAGTGAGAGTGIAYAGGGAVLAGLLCSALPGRSRALVLPPTAVGAVALAAGVAPVGVLRGGPVLVVLMAMLVLGGTMLPHLALAAVVRGVPDLTAAPGDLPSGRAPGLEIDLEALAADARLAEQVLLAMTAALGLVVAVVAPYAVGSGIAGTLCAGASAAVLLLRVRHHPGVAQVRVGLASAAGGALSVLLSVVWLHPGWRPVAGLLLVVAGCCVVLLGSGRAAPSTRLARVGDLVETAGVLAVLPTAVVATGALAAVGG